MQGVLGAGLRACSQKDELFLVHTYLPWITSWVSLVGTSVARIGVWTAGRNRSGPGVKRPLPPSSGMVRGPGEALLMIRLVPEPHPLTLLHS